jgi:nucleotide-binding universal stress UspA family protein
MTTIAQDVSLKDIVVFVGPSQDCEESLRFAAGMAKKQGARLLGIYVAGDPPSCCGYVRGSAAIADMIKTVAVREQRKATTYGNRFLDIASRYNVNASFRVVWNDVDMSRRIVVTSLLADMVVVGKEAPHGLPECWRPEKFMSLSGVPLLMVPAGWRGEVVPLRIAIAWNASKEARRAVAAGISFLRQAQAVDIIVVDDDDRDGIVLALYLARHGVRAKVRNSQPNGLPVSEQILSEAARSEADLVIMGAYSHAKAIRLMFGGTTQKVLDEAKVPVFMSR